MLGVFTLCLFLASSAFGLSQDDYDEVASDLRTWYRNQDEVMEDTAVRLGMNHTTCSLCQSLFRSFSRLHHQV